MDQVINWLKAIGIILVVLGHSAFQTPIECFVGLFHISIFYFTAGYCFKDKYIDTYFISNGLDEADISIRFYGKPIEELEHGDVYTIVMTDDNWCWITVDVTCLEQYHFKSNEYEITYHDLFRGKY